MENTIKNLNLCGASSFSPSENNKIFAELRVNGGILQLSFKHLKKWSVFEDEENESQKNFVKLMENISKKTEKMNEQHSSIFGKVTGTGSIVRYVNNVPVTIMEEVYIAKR